MFTGQTVVFNYFEKKRANMVSGKVISLFCMYPGFPDARAPRNSRKGSGRSISWVLLLLVLGFSCGPLGAQVINEVIAQNSTQDPADVACGHPDMIELYNNTNETVVLGRVSLADS